MKGYIKTSKLFFLNTIQFSWIWSNLLSSQAAKKTEPCFLTLKRNIYYILGIQDDSVPEDSVPGRFGPRKLRSLEEWASGRFGPRKSRCPEDWVPQNFPCKFTYRKLNCKKAIILIHIDVPSKPCNLWRTDVRKSEGGGSMGRYYEQNLWIILFNI